MSLQSENYLNLIIANVQFLGIICVRKEGRGQRGERGMMTLDNNNLTESNLAKKGKREKTELQLSTATCNNVKWNEGKGESDRVTQHLSRWEIRYLLQRERYEHWHRVGRTVESAESGKLKLRLKVVLLWAREENSDCARTRRDDHSTRQQIHYWPTTTHADADWRVLVHVLAFVKTLNSREIVDSAKSSARSRILFIRRARAPASAKRGWLCVRVYGYSYTRVCIMPACIIECTLRVAS